MRTDPQRGGELPGLPRWGLRTACGIGSALLACLALSADAGALPVVEVPLGGQAVEPAHLTAVATEPVAAKSSGTTPVSVTRLAGTPLSPASPSPASLSPASLSATPPSVTSPPVGPPQVQPPEVDPPRLEVPPLDAPKPSVPSPLPGDGKGPPPSPEQTPSGGWQSGAGPGAVPALAAPRRSAASKRVAGRDPERSGASAGSGGVLAPAQQSRPAERAAGSRALHRRASSGATALRRPSGFALVAAPASDPTAVVDGTSSPGGLGAALAPLRAQSSLGLVVLLAAVLAGLALIGLMCADALGVGPRHHAHPRRARRPGRKGPRWP